MLIEVDDPRTINVMGLLQHLNSSELKELLNEDMRLESIIRDSQLVKQQETEKDVLLASNKSLADYNLRWEPKINAGKQKLIDLYQIASQLERNQEEKEKQMEEKSDDITIDTAMGLLQSATLQAEEESEQLAEKFLDRALDVDTFVEEFQQRRKLAHLRKVKSDKMKELVAKQKNSVQPVGIPNHVNRPAPPPPTYITNTSPLPPYPMTSAAGNNLPYPIFPPNNAPSMPYPIYPNSMYPPRF